jgi:quercetin dioxygenase-like cupin family protein
MMLVTLVTVGALSIVWTDVAAQQGGAPAAPDPANFTGKVTPHATDDIRIIRYTFDPAARTNWHCHAGGQTIIVEKGRLRAMERGGTAGKEFGPSQTYVTAPGVEHWHGALPNAPLTQVAVSFGATKWGGKVTDAEYGAGAKK